MSLIDGYTAANHLKKRLMETAINNVGIMASADDVYREMAKNRIDVWIDEIPTVDAVPVIRCKDCIHKPKPTEDYKQGERDNGFEIEFPDYMCPLQCDDAYYSRLPKDDWFCGNAERKADG